MNKRFLILILLLISLISSSIYFGLPEEDINVKEDNIKGESIYNCKEVQQSTQDQLTFINIEREWYIKSPYSEVQAIDFRFTLPKEKVDVQYILNGEHFSALNSKDVWSIYIPIEELDSNSYDLTVLIEVCGEEYSKDFTFNVSNPVYVVWSIDWEGFDVKEEYLNEMDRISRQYSAPMTHYFNPYIYIYLPSQRAKYLTEWVRGREEDSIGLHLHMYNRLVEASGVKVNNIPSWGSTTGNGHDTPNSNYGYEDFKKIMEWSIKKFEENSLERPSIYRAGGWFLDEENIKVLNDLEFNIDSSGRTYYKHGTNQIEGHWNLSPDTQPYILNSFDQNITNEPNLNIWEYPNNGGDSWAFNSDSLISRFKSNYSGGINNRDVVVTYLSHPHWFNREGPNIEGAFKYISQYSYLNDTGPVIFLSLDILHQYTVKH